MGRKVKRSTRKRKTQRGKGIKDVLKKAHSFVKANKLISRGLRLAGKPGLASLADQAGYGRKKRRTRKSGTRAKGSLAALISAVKPVKRRRRVGTASKGMLRGRGISSSLSMGSRLKPVTMRGRGFIGKTLGGIGGSLLGGLLPF